MSITDVLRPYGQSLAIVIFTDSSLRYLRALKKGFRHCMVAVHDGEGWVLLDPLSNGLTVTRLGELPPRDVIRIFTDGGLHAVPVQRAAPIRKELPWAPFTCVEAVKRTLAMRARFVLTPWQLYRTVTRFSGAARGDGPRHKAVNP